jgi:hypothetical protein
MAAKKKTTRKATKKKQNRREGQQNLIEPHPPGIEIPVRKDFPPQQGEAHRDADGRR